MHICISVHIYLHKSIMVSIVVLCMRNSQYLDVDVSMVYDYKCRDDTRKCCVHNVYRYLRFPGAASMQVFSNNQPSAGRFIWRCLCIVDFVRYHKQSNIGLSQSPLR